MSNRKRKRRDYPPGTPCAYCARVPSELEREHVFPDSWYAAGTRQDQMLIVPACPRCNRFFGRYDNDARVLSLACATTNNRVELARASFHRSIDPVRARNGSDRYNRERRRTWVQSLLKPLHPSEVGTALWSAQHKPELAEFRSESGVVFHAYPGMELSHELQATVVHKWTRGSYYHRTGKPLTPFTQFDWRCPTAGRNPIPTLKDIIGRSEIVFETLDFRVWGLVHPGDDRSVWTFGIWNEFIFWSRTGALVDVDPQAIRPTE